MLDQFPSHPYQPRTRVHEATESDTYVFINGSASVLRAEPLADGTFVYVVRRDRSGTEERWPSYFTIPAQTWASPGNDPLSDPLPVTGDGRPAPGGRADLATDPIGAATVS
ncbi:hypothetical protein [Actinorugispora endophytica]|uniref:Uncharacterized protein n=1 Tax=Actinorugispora endophytica TaxID=1605990 RepID=A0A4R6UHM0_9ACTN|nr:hypothetical protein [Actinorugispora endophytica]TDQ45526.1 hypothetical protein EV190_13143 [Actinorugispora endophytica]